MIEMMRKMQVENLALALIEDGLAGYKSFSDFMNAGADDAQPMSIDPAELEARVEALIRRMEKPETPWMLPVGPAMLNSSTGWITSDYGSVHLTECETKTLELLVHKNGSIVTKEMVMNYLYGGRDEPEFKVVDVYICKLRKKLFSICGGKDVIETLWGRGYRYAILGVEPTFTKGRARVAG
ncbi:response regulator transcription factor [Hoeflea sp.]|uniref:response regulator transcription factor n=1 Tax=Hoeflea sp. TaxID=1940281 RepID=UPI003B52691E